MIARVRTLAGVATAALACAGAASAQAAIDAHGSARQVYVTGLPGKAKGTLLNAKGHKVRTKSADADGGLLFRNVKPGSGYRVRANGTTSDPLTVLPTNPAPPNTDIYNQTIPTSGYGYLTTRDGTKLAIYVHPPQDITHAGGVDLPSFPSGQS